MIAGIKVLTIGKPYDLAGYQLRHVEKSSGVVGAIAEFQPDVIVTSTMIPGVLNDEGLELRKRWIHVDSQATLEEIGRAIDTCYAFNVFTKHPAAEQQPLVSVYTPTFNTGDYLRDTYQSLRDQTYRNWEWVVIDDYSSDETWERLQVLAREDARVRPFRSGKRVAKIGAVKDIATRLARGAYLVELDHDDLLTDFALAEIVRAFGEHPGVGMVYSNSCSFYENGTFQKFEGDFWAPRYRFTEYRGKRWLECKNPDIYERFGPSHSDLFAWFLTVGPHHVRAFRATTLRELGGYNPELPVADDWDLYARFFLRSKCLHVDKMLYLYRYRDNHENATFRRNQSIQDHLALGRRHYEDEFRAFNARQTKEQPEPSSVGEAPTALQPGCADLSVVVLDATATSLTRACLQSVREHAAGAELILVANGCTVAPDAAALADQVVQLPHNVLFSAGCNQGAARATRRMLCFLNNDARFVDDTPRKLLEASQGSWVVGPYSNRAKPPQGDHPSAPLEDAYPAMVSGVCLFIPRALFDRLGGFDPRLLTWEDDDLCRRAAALGHRSRVVGGTFVEHERHATFEALGQDVQAIMLENQRKFERKFPNVRVIAIAKNEAPALRDFFNQFRTVTSDWCLLDTGSSDDTVRVAQELGVRVESSRFTDFASARNEALARFASGADWVLMLDPDERLDPRTLGHLPELMHHTRHDAFWAPLEAVNADGTRQAFVPKPFLFRNAPDIRWLFKVHEKLVGARQPALVRSARIDHLMALHDGERRQRAESVYARLMRQERYFSDPAYKRQVLEAWPILDYDRLDDARLEKISIGPLTSVIIPTYRRREALERAVRSALAQEYATLEVIVVGDACPELAVGSLGDDPRLRIYNLPENHGAGGAVPRNHGLALAAGKLIAYLDDDNAWEPDHLSSLVQALGSSDATFAFSSMQVDGRDLGFSEPKFQGIDTSCLLHRRELIAKYGGWKDREQAGYAHDWELVKRWLDGGEGWVCTRQPTLKYTAESSGQADFLNTRAG